MKPTQVIPKILKNQTPHVDEWGEEKFYNIKYENKTETLHNFGAFWLGQIYFMQKTA